ncbi:peptidoglycan DD-metalloendopeptidase family protein [Embleya sp. NPDC056575]|uniref:peptidoglycan DD-metalloendopeptidase family protein n=1 Tax=unclassified Embleya TaxID=2699296 RepID=UPI00369717C8
MLAHKFGGSAVVRFVVSVLAGMLLFIVLIPVLLFGDDGGGGAAFAGTGGALREDAKIPAEYRPHIEQAAQQCPQLTPALLAAQLKQESEWNPRAVSEVGAQGLAQFMPGTWTSYGVDGNGDGRKDPFDPIDAIHSMANYDCVVVKEVAGIPGDPIDLMLAAYNAGPYAVRKYQGVPPYAQTQEYVRIIKASAAELAAPLAATGEGITAIIAWAQQQLGTSYSYGGDCTDAHGTDMARHCDCSSLMQMAYLRGAGLKLPRDTYGQIDAGPKVTGQPLLPGDLVFPNTGHVGMYVGSIPGFGDDTIIEAPKTGFNVRYAHFRDSGYWSKGVVVRPSVLAQLATAPPANGGGGEGEGGWTLPLASYTLTARFGQSGDRWANNHTGLDFAADEGTNVRAVGAGEIVEAGWAGAYGNRLVLRHPDGTVTWYCHLSSFVRSQGGVQSGETIAKVGATGNVTGPHLHLEVRPGGGAPIDPYTWLQGKALKP